MIYLEANPLFSKHIPQKLLILLFQILKVIVITLNASLVLVINIYEIRVSFKIGTTITCVSFTLWKAKDYAYNIC